MTITLAKGQSISLAKSHASTITRVRMGLGWTATPAKTFIGKLLGPREIDLDASAVLYSGAKVLDVIYFNNLASSNGSATHTGDNRIRGDGREDDESILVDLVRLPLGVDQIVFTVNSFSGLTFDEVDHAYCRLVEERSGAELARYTLSGGGSHTAQIMAKVYLADDGWHMEAIGEPAIGQTIHTLLPAIDRHL